MNSKRRISKATMGRKLLVSTTLVPWFFLAGCSGQPSLSDFEGTWEGPDNNKPGRSNEFRVSDEGQEAVYDLTAATCTGSLREKANRFYFDFECDRAYDPDTIEIVFVDENRIRIHSSIYRKSSDG